jgi:zinc transport system ATP-binding protein
VQPPVLEIRDLRVARDGRRLLDGVSLDVAPASIHFLVGPNGAGKSTLFATILGLLEFEGSIRFRWRRSGRIGFVPQFFTVDRTLPLTVREFLALARQRRPICLGTSRAMNARLDGLLARVGAAALLRRPLGALSGGELQRVLLANALEPEPELLLLDEPATGLDEDAAAQLEAVLLEVRAETGTSLLIISHDLAHARRVGDHVTVIDRTVRRTGPPSTVLTGTLAEALDFDGPAHTS